MLTVREPNQISLEFLIWKLNYSTTEAFEDRDSVVINKEFLFFYSRLFVPVIEIVIWRTVGRYSEGKVLKTVLNELLKLIFCFVFSYIAIYTAFPLIVNVKRMRHECEVAFSPTSFNFLTNNLKIQVSTGVPFLYNDILCLIFYVYYFMSRVSSCLCPWVCRCENLWVRNRVYSWM